MMDTTTEMAGPTGLCWGAYLAMGFTYLAGFWVKPVPVIRRTGMPKMMVLN